MLPDADSGLGRAVRRAQIYVTGITKYKNSNVISPLHA